MYIYLRSTLQFTSITCIISIIQEYNICFTTTEIHPPNESDTDWLPEVAPQQEPGILPIQIRNLVQKRRTVKQMMKGEKNEDELARLNIRQLGLKLTANSMYGCLGFSASRFYAQVSRSAKDL